MRFKNLGKYQTGGTSSKMELSIPLPTTPDGRVYRYSPNVHAHPRHFVLGNVAEGFHADETRTARMKQLPGSNKTVCPYSGIIADDEEFNHPDDVQAAIDLVQHAAAEDMENAVHEMFQGLARKNRGNKFIKFETSPKGRARPKPRFGRKDLLRALQCDDCGRDYGVYAIGLFCPDCGAPNVHLHFAREVELVEKQVALGESQRDVDEELAYRLLGNAHEDVLTAFEATLKTVYLFRVATRDPSEPEPPEPKNDFQNVGRGQKRFEAFAFDPFSDLTTDELKVLELNIQKRHVVGHNLGVVDEKFVALAGTAKLGETVGLVGDDIRAFATIAQKVVNRLDNWLAGQQADNQAAEPETNLPGGEMTGPSEIDIPLAEQVAHWLCAKSDDGLEGPIREIDGLQEAFPDHNLSALEEALAELELDGYVSTSHVIGGGNLPRVSAKLDLFLDFDESVLGHSPVEDAAHLIDEILKLGKDSVNVGELHASTSWSLRRFNPAIALVAKQIDERRVSQSSPTEYPTRHFTLVAEDRVALKRFLKRLQG